MNTWRDSQSPEEILYDWMRTHSLTRDPNTKGTATYPKVKIGTDNTFETSETFDLSVLGKYIAKCAVNGDSDCS